MTKTCPTCSQSNQLLRFRIRRLLWTIFFVGTVIAAIATTYQSSRLQNILGKLRITNHELNQEVRRLKTATKKPLFQISTIAQTDHTLKGEINSVHQLRVAEFWKYRIQKSVFHYHDPQATAFQLRVENDLLTSESFFVCRVDRKGRPIVELKTQNGDLFSKAFPHPISTKPLKLIKIIQRDSAILGEGITPLLCFVFGNEHPNLVRFRT